MRYLVGLAVVVVLCGVAVADGLADGEKEAAFRVSYSDVDFGVSGGLDLGSSEDTELSVTYGWMLTDRHELGFIAGYVKQDIDGGDLFADSSTDGTTLGGFYTFNIPTDGMLTPYVGATLATLGGDLGDAYDFQYSAEAGLKVYPFQHAGFSFGLSYTKLRADAQGLPDADGISLGAGLLIKY